MLSLLSRHDATPLVSLTVTSGAEKPSQRYEYQSSCASPNPARRCPVRVVADRRFRDHKLYPVLAEELKFDFVIRFRGNIAVTATSGEARAAPIPLAPVVAREHCAAPRLPLRNALAVDCQLHDLPG